MTKKFTDEELDQIVADATGKAAEAFGKHLDDAGAPHTGIVLNCYGLFKDHDDETMTNIAGCFLSPGGELCTHCIAENFGQYIVDSTVTMIEKMAMPDKPHGEAGHA